MNPTYAETLVLLVVAFLMALSLVAAVSLALGRPPVDRARLTRENARLAEWKRSKV